MKLLPKFQPGGIIRRDGDPYEYTKLSNGKVAYRNKGSKSEWINPSSEGAIASINELFKPKQEYLGNVPKYLLANDKKVEPYRLQYLNKTPAQNKAETFMNQFTQKLNPTKDIDKIKADQTYLRNQGYNIKVDGIWGKNSKAAYEDWNKKQQQAKPVTTEHEKSATDYLNDVTGAIKKGVEVAALPITIPLNYVGTKVRDYASSHSSGIVGQAAPFVADVLGLKTPMTEKSFTPNELALFKTIKDNPNNPNIGNFKTKNAKGENIVIPAEKRRQNTEAHFMYYAENGTPEQKEAARSLMNKIGQGTVANIGTNQPIDYYNFNKSVNDRFSTIDKAKEMMRRPGEDDISYGKRIGTRVIGPMFGTTGTAENDKVGQPTVLASIKKGGLIKRKK